MIKVEISNKIYDHVIEEGCDSKTANYYISLIEEEIRKDPDPNNILQMQAWIEVIREQHEPIS